MATSIKTIKNHLTDDTIYPVTKASAVYLNDDVTTIEGLLGDTSIASIGDGTITGAISALNNVLSTVAGDFTKSNGQSNLVTGNLSIRKTGHVVSINGFVGSASITANTETPLFTIDNTTFRPPFVIRAVGLIGSQAYGTGTPCYISVGVNGEVAVTSATVGTSIRFNITYITNS